MTTKQILSHLTKKIFIILSVVFLCYFLYNSASIAIDHALSLKQANSNTSSSRALSPSHKTAGLSPNFDPNLDNEKIFRLWHKEKPTLPMECARWNKQIACPGSVTFEKILRHSSFFHVKELDSYIKKQKNSSIPQKLKEEHFFTVPALDALPLYRKDKPSAKQQIRAIYLPQNYLRSKKIKVLIERAKRAEINGIVFDIKNAHGEISIPFQNPQVAALYQDRKWVLDNPAAFIAYLQSQGMSAISRIVIFQDRYLAKKRTDWAIQTRGRSPSGAWISPANKNITVFYQNIVNELASLGVDEIQLDYVRFPADDEVSYPVYPELGARANKQKSSVINEFMANLKKTLAPYPVLLSADIFGITAWNDEKDKWNLGQDIHSMANHLDLLCPMLYPSHFNYEFAGLADPASHPDYFLYNGVLRSLNLVQNKIPIRPWIQAFPYRVKNFTFEYIKAQINAAERAGGVGFLLWHASGKYDKYFEHFEKR